MPRLKKDGLIVGNNFDAMDGVIIDPGHCWLIEIGDNVTLAPRVHILAHDASMKKSLGYVRIGKVSIGNNCFIGAGSIILPSVQIDDNTIIGAGSVVTRSLFGGGYMPEILAGNYLIIMYGLKERKENLLPCHVLIKVIKLETLQKSKKKK